MAIASFRAGETIAAGDAVYVDPSDGLIFKASALNATQASVVGVAIDSGSVGTLIRVNADGIYPGLSGLSPGEYQYLSVTTSGALVDYATWSAELATVSVNAYVTNIGRATSATQLAVEIDPPTLVVNPTSVLMLESSSGITIDAILLEDGSTIDLETASV
jgi:hypothetical protein